ncbi:MAG: hypothetical protein FJ312_01080 [SAR202 cluster bacterium]|nr:hypothetical protein [SAR202 cluster bacterium]
MAQDTSKFIERNLTELLNETFAVYWRHLREFLLLALLVQLPLAAISWAAGEGVAGYIIVLVCAIIGGAVAYGAGIYAVGQQYVTDKITIRNCYRRAQWRLLSLLAITAAITVVAILGVGLILIVVPFLVAMVYLVYWSVAGQAIIIEGRKPLDALKRSLELVRGDWWRVFGIILIFLLVAAGFGLMVNAPFVIASWIVGTEPSSTVDAALRFFGGLAVGTAVAPILAIAWTLLYYDLRLRKEDYDLEILSQELGLVSSQAQGPA